MSAEPSDPVKSLIPALGSLWAVLEPHAYTLLRAGIGGVMAIHGAARFRLIDIGGPTIESTAKFNAAFGVEPALFWSYYVSGLELVGGLLLVLGLFTRVVALLFSGFLLIATVYVTPHFGFWSRDGGFEYSLILLIAMLAILARGGGRHSLDRRIGREL